MILLRSLTKLKWRKNKTKEVISFEIFPTHLFHIIFALSPGLFCPWILYLLLRFLKKNTLKSRKICLLLRLFLFLLFQGVKAVIAESFERIHRSNLVGMGIVPLQFLPGENAESLKLTGHEKYTIPISPDIKPLQKITVTVRVCLFYNFFFNFYSFSVLWSCSARIYNIT